jgi:acyl-CoA thioesterase
MSPDEHSVSIIRAVNTPHQFSFENGILLTDVEPGYAKGELTVGPDSINPHGNVHGGALATLADTVSGCCACSKGGSCVTACNSMEFLRPATGPTIYCEATPKKMGRSLSVIQVVLTNAQHAVVATGTFTFFMFHE